MHLLWSATAVAASLALGACAPRVFYPNGPRDARAETTAVSVRAIDAENKTFRVYKVNGSLYALIPTLAYSSTLVDELNRALILSPAQRDSLVAAATRISAAHDRRDSASRTLILFELTDNATETLTQSSSVGTRIGFQTSGSAVEVNRIIFRLQYLDEGASRLQSGQRIDYMLFSSSGSMSIGELRALIGDLSK